MNQKIEKINVLDKGFVRLVDSMGSDLSIVRAARVSYDADWRAGEDTGSDSKLIRYLIKNKHTSPFEAVAFTFEIKAPIFVIRQWQRHRTWSFNEISGRYTEMEDEFYLPDLNQITHQSSDNKQMRTDIENENSEDIRRIMEKCMRDCFSMYKEQLKLGCPRELARTVLPLSTYTRMFCTVNLHNLIHFLKLRQHKHAQHEIREYANAMEVLIKQIVPITMFSYTLDQL